MSNTFTPKKGVTYYNKTGPNQGVTAGPTRQTPSNTKQSTYYAPSNRGVLSTTTYAGGSGSASNGGGQSQPVSFQDNGNDEARRAAEEEVRRREEQTRNEINSGYSAYESNLRGLEGSYGQARDEESASASKTYETLFGGLNEQKAANLAKLEANRGGVETRRASSIKDLQQNLSNTLRAATMSFGASGAGDTSATRVMLPYAYTKLAGQEEGGIHRQANDQLFQIDQDQSDTELEFSKMWKETEIEKENKLQSIRTYYGDAIRNVQSAIAQAPLDKARDLASLSQSLLAEARSRLSSLEAEDRQRKSSIQSWATERMSQLNNMRLQLSNNANFNPQDIVMSELPMMAGVQTGGGGQDPMYNPLLVAQKRRDQYLS